MQMDSSWCDIMTDNDEIKVEILRVMVESFLDENDTVALRATEIIDEVKGSSGFSEEDIFRSIRQLWEDFVIDYTNTSGDGVLELKGRSIEEYERISGDKVIPNGHILKIINLLYEAVKENPRKPSVSRSKLLQDTGLSEDELDRAVWYLYEKNFVDATTNLNQPWWEEAQITRSGQRLYERL